MPPTEQAAVATAPATNPETPTPAAVVSTRGAASTVEGAVPDPGESASILADLGGDPNSAAPDGDEPDPDAPDADEPGTDEPDPNEDVADPAAAAEDEEPVFNQEAFDARMAEMAGATGQAAPASAQAQAPPWQAPTNPLENFERIDVESMQYDGERAIAGKFNELLDVVSPIIGEIHQMRSIAVAQVAENVAGEMQAGAQTIEQTYGIRIAPEQMEGLLRRNVDLAHKGGGFTRAVVLEAFERENWKAIMASKTRPAKAAAKKAPETIPGQGASRLGAGGKKASEDDLILRDLS